MKNGELPENYSAKGLNEAKKKLDKINLTDEEKVAYKRNLSRLRDIASEQHTKMVDAKQLIKEGEEKGMAKGMDKKEKEAVLGMDRNNIPISVIANALNISEERVKQIIEEEKSKK